MTKYGNKSTNCPNLKKTALCLILAFKCEKNPPFTNQISSYFNVQHM